MLHFQPSVDSQQLRVDQHTALPLAQILPDHHIDHAEFVFQGKEDHTAGRAGFLPADHQPGHADVAAMLDAPQLPRTAAALAA